MVQVQTTLEGARVDVRQLQKDLNELDVTATKVHASFALVLSSLDLLALPPEMDGAVRKMREAVVIVWQLYAALKALETGTSWGLLVSAITLPSTIMSGLGFLDDALKGNQG